MMPFEFGQLIGTVKHASVGDAIVRSAFALNPLTHGAAHALVGAPIGAALGAYNAPQGQKLRGAGRGALTGAATGAGVGAAGALAGKAIGGIPKMMERGVAGGMKNNLINQLPNLASIGGGVAGYQLAKKRPQPTTAKAANVNFRLAGNLPATIAGKGVQGAPFRDTARQTLEAGRRLAGMAGQGVKTVAGDVARALPRSGEMSGLAGATGLLGGMLSDPGKRVESAGRGVGYAAGASLGGGVGAGLGKSVSRLLPQKYQIAAQLAGGGLGTLAGVMGANKMMGAPSSAGKQAGMVGDAAKTVVEKGKQVAGKAEETAKTVANKAFEMGEKMQTNFDKWRKSK